MLISLEWLGDLVDIKGLAPEEIAEALTMSGLEVEEIEYLKPKFNCVYTGKIIDIKPHPDAAKIRLATVDYGDTVQQVVCGASNIEKGQIIAFAIEGATVYNRKDATEFKLKKAKIRGVESSGMICSASELCLEGPEYEPFSEGIVVLSEMNRFKGKDIELGYPIEKLLELPEDIVLHAAPTANRGDLMSMRGIANEISSIFNRERKLITINVDCNSLNSDETFDVEIIDPETCKYYALGLVKDVKIKPSPVWMANRLEAAGMRPINNVVDITNYVMLEYGQPLHAFDYTKLPEKYLCVRRAKDNESIKTLDGIERNLVTDNVVIATKTKAVALAGVMGDETSEVDSMTQYLALESAYFTPATNRKSSRAVGLRTEACSRFERGVDINTVEIALKRTMQLMAELAEAKTAGIFDTGKPDYAPVLVELRFSQVKRILGIDIQKHKCIEILKNLDFILCEESQEHAKFEVPSYRTQDVFREIDLIEEISRIYGYDKIVETIPHRTSLPQLPEEDILVNKVKTILNGKGMTEIVTSSLIGYPLLNWSNISIIEEKAVRVANPQSDEYTMLRQSMIPSLINVVKYNIDRDIKDFSIFEIGKTYFIERAATEKDPGTDEHLMLAGAITGDNLTGKIHIKNNVSFFTLKGIIEDLLDNFGLLKRVEFLQSSDINYMHPGRTAYLNILGKPKMLDNSRYNYLGFFGELHPGLKSKCKLGQDVLLFEINLNQLILCQQKLTSKYKSLPQYPSVLRDIAFTIDDNISYADVDKVIKKSGAKLLKHSEIFDIYKGNNISEGLKSFAIRLTLQDLNTTLTDDVVEMDVEKVRKALQEKFNVCFR
ncbi:MAG: phenylalanine--tRNA ligase subunit beta [Cyanobacteriota bacterium]